MAIFPIVLPLEAPLHAEIQNPAVCQNAGTRVEVQLGYVFMVGKGGPKADKRNGRLLRL